MRDKSNVEKKEEQTGLFLREKPQWLLSIQLRALVVLAFGVILYTASFVPAFALFRGILSGVGLALVIAMIVAITVERLTHETLLRRVDMFLGSMEETLDVVKGAEDTGVEDLFARRFGKSSARCSMKLEDAIHKQLAAKQGEILILGVAAPDIFRFDRKPGRDIQELILRDSECRLRVILLDDESDWGNERQKVESFHDPKGDINRSFSFLTALAQGLEGKKDRIQFKKYGTVPPMVFLVITEDTAFVEPYPLLEAPVTGPIGGRIPMLQFRSDSEGYKLWKAHFEYMWKKFSFYHPESPQPSQT